MKKQSSEMLELGAGGVGVDFYSGTVDWLYAAGACICWMLETMSLREMGTQLKLPSVGG